MHAFPTDSSKVRDAMEWTKTPPRAPGLYWYRHRDGRKLANDANAAEPVKMTSDGKVLFVGDWRAHCVEELEQGLWGGHVESPASQ